jgi:filamentous hemagglutinin family protein
VVYSKVVVVGAGVGGAMTVVRFGWMLGIAMGGSLWANGAVAQIAPDSTLPSNSIVTQDGSTFNITGGTQAGNNLFHSFQDFSVPTGSTAFFNNVVDIQNIISRVTGGNISNIDGLIRTLGSANLFLINPNGIVFGANARLDVSGSFIGSTASSIRFGDGFEFSAKNPQSAPLLTIGVPTSLQYGASSGSIQVKGDGQGTRLGTSELINTENVLRVKPNQTLALVGGDINLVGGTLKTAGGRIELGSVSGESQVSLIPNGKGFALGYDRVQNFGNIELSQQATVDASGSGGGDVQVVGKRVTLKGGSQIEASTLGAQSGGTLSIRALEALEVIGVSDDARFPPTSLVIVAYPEAQGNGGDLTITTQTLKVQDGAQVSTGTLGAGNGGNLIVKADTVEIIGVNPVNKEFPTGLFAPTGADATGSAGNLTIDTSRLLVRDGAIVSASTLGAGNGGNLTVKADTVEVIGVGLGDSQFRSTLSTSALPGSTGSAGDLTIDTRTLLVQDGAQVQAATSATGDGGNLTVKADTVEVIGVDSVDGSVSALFADTNTDATGSAGDLTIDTSRLRVRDGAQISATTFGKGNGGSLTVTADTIEVIGVNPVDSQFSSGLFASAQPNATGNAGDLRIKTQILLVRDGAGVSVGSFNTAAGIMTLNARSIRLDNNAALNANTRSAQVDSKREQATINISSQNLILRRNSYIRTNATGENVIGGNININSDIIAAIENSDITANSASSRGGNVRINVQGIFGIQPTDRQTLSSDITATGGTPDLGGNLDVNSTIVDYSLGLVELPLVLVDASGLLDSGCVAKRGDEKSEFFITGRGGLPLNPREAFDSNRIITRWVSLDKNTETQVHQQVLPTSLSERSTNNQTRLVQESTSDYFNQFRATKPITTIPKSTVPATGWIFNGKGDVTLISHAQQAQVGSTTCLKH